MLTFQKLREVNLKRQDERFRQCLEWNPADWAVALAGECGEMCNLIKKLKRGDDIDISLIGKEIADIVIYSDLLAAHLGLDLEHIVADKFNEVSDRVDSNIKIQ